MIIHTFVPLPVGRQLETSKCPSVRELNFAVAEIRSLDSYDTYLHAEYSTTRPWHPSQVAKMGLSSTTWPLGVFFLKTTKCLTVGQNQGYILAKLDDTKKRPFLLSFKN